MKPDFCIYPSLLDKFQMYLDSDRAVEERWNITEDGDYKLTADEIAAQRKSDLLDSVNRVRRPVSEAASLGTAFNWLVDSVLEHGTDLRYMFPQLEQDENYIVTAPDPENGMQFPLSLRLAGEVASMLSSPIAQYYVDATLPTRHGNVMLYGYPDYWCSDGTVADLKTTGRYEWPKYERSWQRWVYPWCIKESKGADTDIFRFVCVKWSKPTKARPYYDGTIYREDYNYDHEMATAKLTAFVEQFVTFLKINRSKITDKKIFGEIEL